MDNCLLSNTKILPNWYIKVLSYFPNYRTYNNFFNDKDFDLYKMIKPTYGIYSLKNIYDILKIHTTLNNQDIIMLKYDKDILTLFEYSVTSKKFEVKKIISNNISIDYDFINLVNAILTNDPKVMLSEELFIGTLYALKIKQLQIPNLQSNLAKLKHDECLKFYKTSKNYHFIYNALDGLIHSYAESEPSHKYKIKFTIPDNILIANILCSNSLDVFKNGSTTAPKKDIIYHIIILSIIIGRFCKQTGFKQNILKIEYVLEQYLSTLNLLLRNDLLIMIKLFEHNRILYKKDNQYYITPNYEESIYTFFINSSYWWSLKNNFKQSFNISYNDINDIANNIYDNYDDISKNKYIHISCHSGCDNTFIEKCNKIDNSLLFIETLPSLFSSEDYDSAAINSKGMPYNDISINYGININIYTSDGSVYLDLNDNKKLTLIPIFSKETVIDHYKNDDVIVLEYNLIKMRFTMIQLIKLDIAQYLLFIKDSIQNKNVIYTSDPNMRLLAHLYGINLIYEKISNGKRYLELYNSISSNYDI